MKLVKKTCPCTKPILYDQKNDLKKKKPNNWWWEWYKEWKCITLMSPCLVLLNSYLTLDNHREDHTAPCRKVGWSLGWPCIFFSILHSNLGPCCFLQPHLKKPTPPLLRLSAVLPSSWLPWFLSSHLWYICNVRRVLNIYSEGGGGGRAGFVGVGVGWLFLGYMNWMDCLRKLGCGGEESLGDTLKKYMGILKLTLGVKFDQK